MKLPHPKLRAFVIKQTVAFTPKGGCPLKPCAIWDTDAFGDACSIHPQGWVPVETPALRLGERGAGGVAFTPKGGCPLKPHMVPSFCAQLMSSIHPQGWVPVETLGETDTSASLARL